ncbi:hypothetical protein Ddye_029636 [Dipteronia dyeriana]|uniref:Reverse transcriptase zinc-binding domain-containing protein n=1 Tax=Dipteronia dyeriana TaxID=168575 RepID=A0AAD9WKS2_9ROSI|nr:hypothetical protein Ddye_029636 [Dipteronia dyeriana]
MVSLASSSGLSGSVSWWKFLWLLRIPSKIKIFVWRACWQWIPTLDNIARRGVMTVVCPICGVKPESTLHALWGCSGLADVRSSSAAFQKLPWIADGIFMDFITSCARILVVREMEFLCVVLWRIRWKRNQVVHGVFNRCEGSIVGWAYDFLFKFWDANSKGFELAPLGPVGSSS